MRSGLERIVVVVMSIAALVIFTHVIMRLRSHEPHMDNHTATNIAADYMAPTGIIRLDAAMEELYGYVSIKPDFCSWLDKDQIWLTVKDDRITAVNCRAGFDQAIWVDEAEHDSYDNENPDFYIICRGEKLAISAETLAALFSAADGHYDGFENVS